MSLKHKQKVYLSLSNDLLDFVQEQSRVLGISRSKYITSLLLREYEVYQRKRINKIIEGAE
jgi:hypothetical protein